MHLFDFLTILCTVSMLGAEFSIAAFINPALLGLDKQTWEKCMPALAQVMGRAMPFWYFLGLLVIGVEVYLRRSEAARWPIGVAFILWAMAILYSVTMLVPINNRIATISSGAPSATRDEHRRWDILHRFRVVLLGVASGCLIVGILWWR